MTTPGGGTIAPGGEAFVEDLRPAIRQAAGIARSLEGRVPNRPKSGEDTAIKAALTLADTASQEALLVPLLERFSDVRLEAEEETDSVERFSGTRDARVVIDPIDGTLRSYLQREGPYAILAGLAVADRYEGVWIGLPREDLFIHAVRGGGAFVAEGDAEPRPARAEADGDRLIVSYDLPEPVAVALRERGFELVEGCGGAVAVAPLLPGVAGGVRVPDPAPVSVRGRIGLLASCEAGACAATASGPAAETLATPLPELAVAASEAVLADLVAALRTLG